MRPTAHSDHADHAGTEVKLFSHSLGRLRAYANVSYSAGRHERQVSGKGIESGKTRSRPSAGPSQRDASGSS